MAKGISERDSLLGKLRQQLDDTTASEAVMADDFSALEQQLADAAVSEGFARSQCQTAERAHAGITRQVRAMDEAITSARIRLENNGKVIDELRKQASELTLQLADARSSEGVTGARLATAEATIADLRRQLAKSEDIYDELMCLAKKKDRTIADLRISHARYEFVRTLTPHAFTFLWRRSLRGDKFDAMVDELILERAKAVKNEL